MKTLNPKILELLPEEIVGFRVIVTTYNENVVDITPTVTEISIYESLFSPTLYGEMVIIDMSAMLSILPFIGQERVTLVWERNGEKLNREFYITDVYDVKTIADNTLSYGLTLTSEKQMINSVSLFSRSYRGSGDEIISKVHREFLKEDVEVLVEARSSHNVVFPYIKPLSAISMITNNVLADDGSPMFLFESLYGRTTKLDSFKNMYDQDTVADLKPYKITNVDTDKGNPLINPDIGRVTEYTLYKGNNTLYGTANGLYGSSTVSVDLSSKQSPTFNDFDYRVHAPSVSKDIISDYYGLNNYNTGDTSRLNDIRTTKLHYQPKNRYAFNNDFPNLNSTEENTKAIIASYMKRIQAVTLRLYMDALPYMQVGRTVDFEFPRSSPKLYLDQGDTDDKVNSGKYLIASIRHYIKNQKYTMSVELMRDGMGDEAEFYTSDVVQSRESLRKHQVGYDNPLEDNIRDRQEMETRLRDKSI